MGSIFDAMGLARPGTGYFSRPKYPALLPDYEGSLALHHEIDLVVSRVAVNRLLLAGFQAVDVTEHSRALEEIDLLHLVGVKTPYLRDLFHIHGV